MLDTYSGAVQGELKIDSDGGANYSMLLDRSADWPTYRSTLNGSYPDDLDDTENCEGK